MIIFNCRHSFRTAYLV